MAIFARKNFKTLNKISVIPVYKGDCKNRFSIKLKHVKIFFSSVITVFLIIVIADSLLIYLNCTINRSF